MNMITIEEQRNQCRQWTEWFRAAGYETLIEWVADRDPGTQFDREWQVWTAGGEGRRVGTIYYSGTGAEWAGDDDVWMKVIAPHWL